MFSRMLRTTSWPSRVFGGRRLLAIGLGIGMAASGGMNMVYAQKSGDLISGIEMQHVSKSIGPGKDFFQYVNEGWLESTKIPDDQSNYGSFTALDDATKETIRVLIEKAAEDLKNATGPAKQVGSLYRSVLDTAARNAAGIKPIEPWLAKIRGAKTKQELTKVMAELDRIGVGGFFGMGVAPDAKKSDQYAVYMGQGGTTLPDRDYYLLDDAKSSDIRTKFRAYVVDMLKVAGNGTPEKSADAILDLETQFAKAQWPRVELRDPIKRYNKMERSEVKQMLSAIDFGTYATVVGAPEDGFIIVGQPSFMKAANSIIESASLENLQDFMVFSTLDTFAPSLTEAIEKRHFDFHETVLSGITEQRPMWRRAVDTCNRLLGMPIGQLYVEKNFPPEAKKRMQEMVGMLTVAFGERIEMLDWMSPGTKQQAKEKLAKFTTKIGYPDKWKDYSSVVMSEKDFVGNLIQVSVFEHQYNWNKLGKPIDRTEWGMFPQTINAYYNPTMNEIVFPAAILQPPFFNLKADDAVNYGGIGAVIGHELSHGFDDSGCKFDGDGNLRNWWTTEDQTEFERRANQLVKQYDGYKPFSDMGVNGKFTLGENIGDLGGLAVAYHAYGLSLKGKEAPVMDNLTGDQRFFMGWSQIWRRKYRDTEMRKRLMTDPHSPSQYRVIGIVSNMDAFYKAFNIKPGDEMYIAPENRVRIW